jgi:hypothetical protein
MSDDSWWGAYELADGDVGRWQIGPRTLWLYHTAHEWRVLARAGEDSLEASSHVDCPLPPEERDAVLGDDFEADEVHRYSYRQTTRTVTLRPALADRPVVVRPEDPLSVPAGEEVTLYLSTPLWIQVLIGEGDDPVHELPSHRGSDTWFGTSTRAGELCYAARTAGRLALDDVPLRRHRAVTPLRVRNEATDTLPIERVQLPTQHLALYRAPNGFVWTQGVTMRRARAGEGAQVDVADGPPTSTVPDLDAPDRIADPRSTDRKGLVVNTFRALEALFGQV